MHADFGRPVIWSAATGSFGATPSRYANVLVDPADRLLAFASDSCGYPADRTLFVGDFDVEPAVGGLVAVHRATGERIDLLDLVGDPLSANLTHYFGMVSAAAYTPRISFDNLVVQRETWRLSAADLPWVHIADERARYLAGRRFVTDRGLPRYVFVRVDSERKPVFVDLTSLSSLELMSRAVRRAQSSVGDTARITVSEMLPTPDQLWLTDAHGRRYTSELRICAADRRGR
jgi:lantibiotic biosynthesis dehydratase-like protein